MTSSDALPSSQRVVPGSVDIPIAPWPVTTKDETVDASAVSSQIIDSFNSSLAARDYKALANLFVEENSYWRDHLGMTWDFRTAKGRDKIISFLEKGHYLKSIGTDREYPVKNAGPEVADLRGDGTVYGIQFYVRTTSEHGIGPGLARLIKVNGEWKIWTLFTSMQELNAHPEPVGRLRPIGVQHGAQADRKNWLDRREAEFNFENGDPEVLVIGCGQAGLSVQARLKMLGVPTLAIDICDNIGDNWRGRYHQLVLHDAVWYDHLPYLPFPDFWPVFTPKDKLAEFLKSYAEMLELNVWNNTSLEYSSWDDKKKQWTAVLKRGKKDGSVEVRVMHPKHIIQCTGHSGKKNYPNFKGQENFKGDVLCHSSDFRGAKKNGKGRKAIVIGACNSAMDISQDFYEKGYDVTMIQRSSTTVMTSKAVLDLLLWPSYREGGPPTEEADLLTWGKPGEVYKAIQFDLNERQQVQDKDILEGLNKAGFKTDRGPMNAGLWTKYLQRGGGYYIDVGTSQLIIDGKVKVKHGLGISEILPHAVKLEDGTELEADEIVCATGYQNMKTATEVIFGDEIASKVKSNVWGYDEEGETKVMWRQSGHPGLWLHGGNLAMCRYFSRLVAIQIKAQLEGLSKISDL
ncbi:FAD/NAD(P)-binding domain-containing protein [Annulohypoxylon maeteangense]|uniref:FAD/NAD(P)-binding domain-containing protein n=1 Tax=Annulohypoxylon maeteangense TaxID=1927788 RepID=UPI0020082C7E|nr:FAD/NAD(P)-binding domain-containing protein [Annulohypoxylon maeteangense]KAI0889768.1 FAD/NAD(P)-binding domain-containing protein [Annulohypoxylon maeteangense]